MTAGDGRGPADRRSEHERAAELLPWYVNGTLAAALGLGLRLWIAGIIVWMIGHTLAVFAAKRDPQFAQVLGRHLRQKGWLAC